MYQSRGTEHMAIQIQLMRRAKSAQSNLLGLPLTAQLNETLAPTDTLALVGVVENDGRATRAQANESSSIAIEALSSERASLETSLDSRQVSTKRERENGRAAVGERERQKRQRRERRTHTHRVRPLARAPCRCRDSWTPRTSTGLCPPLSAARSAARRYRASGPPSACCWCART